MNRDRRAWARLCAAACLCAIVVPAVAQTSKGAANPKPPPAVAPPPAPPAPDAPPPYEPDLLRLAELMGTLGYLRDLCGDGDGAQWRERMAALLNAEGQSPERKGRLAGAFNHGFRGYELIYRTCTPAAHVVIDRSLDEASRIAHRLDSQ